MSPPNAPVSPSGAAQESTENRHPGNGARHDRGPGTSGNTGKIILSAGIILFFALEWVLTARLSGNYLISRHRRSDLADFSEMIASVSDTVARNCSAGGADTVYFTDDDVVTPYLDITKDHLAGCRLVRVTDVTPVTAADLQGCGKLMISQDTPPRKLSIRQFPPYDGAPFKRTLITRWRSPDGKFSYDAYRNMCSNKY